MGKVTKLAAGIISIGFLGLVGCSSEPTPYDKMAGALEKAMTRVEKSQGAQDIQQIALELQQCIESNINTLLENGKSLSEQEIKKIEEAQQKFGELASEKLTSLKK